MDNVDAGELARKRGGTKMRCVSVVVLLVGMVTLVVGVVVLVMGLTYTPGKRDAEYLVEVGAWQLIDEPSVVWNFTELGKGTLTTNGHTNDYDFIWAIEGDELKIETAWLYTLNDAYAYTIDQATGRLILTEGDKTVTFVAYE